MTENHPNIRRWLGSWLEQMPSDDEYRVLQYELAHEDEQAQYQTDLARLDSHLQVAADSCRDFHKLIEEKQQLPNDREEANRTILDKLAEVRSVVGLQKLGFTSVAFTESPDLEARYEDSTYAIEVTRLAASTNTADSWWESSQVLGDGATITVASSIGRLPVAMSKQIYSKIDSKGKQLNSVVDPISPLVWISLGRDYFTVGEAERAGTGLKVHMRHGYERALDLGIDGAVKNALIPRLRGVVLCPGRDEQDVWRQVS